MAASDQVKMASQTVNSAAEDPTNILALETHREGAEGSPQATARLRKELMKILHDDAFRNQFRVEPVGNSLYEWHARLLLPSFDRDSSLYQDLLEIKRKTGKEGILLHLQFKKTYPTEPPFIRVVEPLMYQGYIFNGTVCIEVLMPQRWKPAYSLGVLLLEIAASIGRGEGRVVFDDDEGTVACCSEEQTLEKARNAFEQLKIMPDINRWTSLYKNFKG